MLPICPATLHNVPCTSAGQSARAVRPVDKAGYSAATVRRLPTLCAMPVVLGENCAPDYSPNSAERNDAESVERFSNARHYSPTVRSQLIYFNQVKRLESFAAV